MECVRPRQSRSVNHSLGSVRLVIRAAANCCNNLDLEAGGRLVEEECLRVTPSNNTPLGHDNRFTERNH